MSDRDWHDAEEKDTAAISISIEEDELPGLLEEKRRRDELSRQIAFGEGL